MLITIGISAERVILGYHSIAQVTVGSLMGIFLHLYSTRMPQFMIFFDAIVQVICIVTCYLLKMVLGAVLLQVDPNLVYNFDDMSKCKIASCLQ